MARGDNADVLLRIRGTDDGGLRLLDAYRKEVARLRRDIEDLNKSGQMRNERGQFMSKADTARLQAANEYRKVQNQAFAEQARNVQREQQSTVRSFQARSQAQKRYQAAETAAHIENQRRTTNANNTNAAYQNSQLRFQQRINAAHQQALQMNTRLQRGGGGTGAPQIAQMEQEDRLWQRLRNSVLAYWAARTVGRSILGFVREGLAFNQILETAQLGIASIITATSKVQDSNGKILEGAKALEGAYGLAADQMQKIRIAGLQTAATTEQLVDAFQQGLGPGLKAGLNLDQIRQVTVQIVQAAGAIGLPFNQLNQEVRSILDATIDRNSRVARVLRITNEEVRLAREQGRLADFLLQRMNAFTVAGGRAATTMAVLRSNIKEAFQVFAGQATSDLFVKMRDSLNAVFAKAFDFKNLRIAEQFQGLVQGIQGILGQVGDLFVVALNKAIAGAQELSQWFKENHVQVQLTFEAMVRLVSTVGGLVGDIVLIAARMVGITGATNTFAATLNTVSDILDLVRSNITLILGVFIEISLIKFATSGGFLNFLALLASPAGPLIAVTTAMALLLLLLEEIAAKNELAARAAARLAEQHTKQLGAERLLALQYVNLSAQLDKTTKGSAEYMRIGGELADITSKLITQYPQYAEILNNETLSNKQRAAAIRGVTDARIADLRIQAAELQALYKIAQAKLKAAQDRTLNKIIGAVTGMTPTEVANATRQLELVGQASQETADLIKSAANAAREASGLSKLITSPSTTPTKGSKNDPQQIRAAALEAAKAEFDLRRSLLKEELDDEDITRQQFHDKMIEQINIRADAEIAAHKKLLAVTSDIGERAKINADIEAAEKQRIQDIADFEVATNKETRRLAKAAIIAQAKDVRDMIQQSNIDVRQAATAINQKIIRGEISKQQGAREFKQVLQDEIDKTIDFIRTLEDLKQTMKDPAQITAVDEMVLRLRGHIVDLNTAVARSDQVLQLFGQAFRESTEKNLTDALDTLIEKSHSLAGVWRNLDDVFRAMALSIISDISHIISRMIALQIVESAVGLFGFGDFLGGIRAASGGLVLGSGTSTSDSIPARLSSGEYVMRASAVKQVGVEALDMINYGAAGARMRSRGSGYAAGGAVESIARTGIASLRVGLDRGLILETMRSPEGAKIHVEHAGKHRNKLRQVARG